MISLSEAMGAGLKVGFMMCNGFLPWYYWLVLAIVSTILIAFKFNDFKQSTFLKGFIFTSVSIGLFAGFFPALFMGGMALDSSSTPAMVGYIIFGTIEAMTGLAGLALATPIAYSLYAMRKF